MSSQVILISTISTTIFPLLQFGKCFHGHCSTVWLDGSILLEQINLNVFHDILSETNLLFFLLHVSRFHRVLAVIFCSKSLENRNYLYAECKTYVMYTLHNFCGSGICFGINTWSFYRNWQESISKLGITRSYLISARPSVFIAISVLATSV